jgi:hypothetical protein
MEVDVDLDRRRFLLATPTAFAVPAMTAYAFSADADRLERDLRSFVEAYEDRPLRQSVTEIGELWRRAATMMRARPNPVQRRRLASLTARISTMRADALYNAGGTQQARRLTDTAHRLAIQARDPETAGTARRVRASLEAFEGRADDALGYARDGLRYIHRGPVAAALAAQEARAAALAPRPDPAAVHRAASRATEIAFDLPAYERGIPGIYFDTYHPVEAAYHATIAHAEAGESARAEEYADLALPALRAMGLPGYRAVALAALALDAARGGPGARSLDRACALADEALEAARGLSTFTPLTVELTRFVQAVGPHPGGSEVRATVARIRARETPAKEAVER